MRDGMVILKSRGQCESHVQLVLLDDRAFSSDGWSEFLTQKAVALGSIIQFKLESQSYFKYRIMRTEENGIRYVGVGNAPHGIVQNFNDVEDDANDVEVDDPGEVTDTSISGAFDDARAEANSGSDAGN